MQTFIFLRISKGSCGEVTNCLLFSIKINYCTSDEVFNSLELSKTLSRQIGAMMKYLRQKMIEKKLSEIEKMASNSKEQVQFYLEEMKQYFSGNYFSKQ